MIPYAKKNSRLKLLMSKDIKIDEATLEELSVIFTWAQVTIDTQYDSRTTKDMQNLIVAVAQKIGLFANETKMASLVRQSFSSEGKVQEKKLPAQILEFPYIGINPETLEDEKEPDK